jgi:hypothetical protein
MMCKHEIRSIFYVKRNYASLTRVNVIEGTLTHIKIGRLSLPLSQQLYVIIIFKKNRTGLPAF